MQLDLFSTPTPVAHVFNAPLITLRPYQAEAVDAVYAHLRSRNDNPCVEIPTGGGKTPIIATICRDAVTEWKGRVLVLAHVKELLQQAAEKLRLLCPQVPVGIYSAGLNRRESRQPVIVAGIQSIFRKACEIDAFDLIIVDEAHLIPADGDGMYRQFLADAKVVNPNVRVIGLTATPFRMSSGPICGPDSILNHICYSVGVRELIVAGYLSPLVSQRGCNNPDFAAINARGGEFVAADVEQAMDDDLLVGSACLEIAMAMENRRACLIFATGVAHGQHICRVLKQTHSIDCGFITGETPTAEREKLLAAFQAGQLRYLCNVNVLTTGFDAPHIDCVALMRPTLSPGLYYQMVGRGFRLFEGKKDCLILDFGGNVKRHGPVDALKVAAKGKRGSEGEAPAKECPKCPAVIAAGYAVCPQCGYEFPPPDRNKHEAKAGDAAILSGEVKTEEFEVLDVRYYVHEKRKADEHAPKTMRVEYKVSLAEWHREWICLEHTGWARQKAEAWWKKRSPDPCPTSAERAVEIAECGGLALPLTITVRTVSGDDWPRIIDCKLADMPLPMAEEFESERPAMPWERPSIHADSAFADDDIPF